ncbi:MAG: 16S rRNA (guanine(966)-N(2))-methyltransferase RsmD [Cyanobacteriota bacterium]|nr:16S rRNA (guanine(966)-N(2))-methyltransferase RsmD [Cyanobacteriota bacterium]
MRIYGNRPLKTLPGSSTRPTSARVREALFNIWQGTLANCRWLDLCAGNGSMGAEALCRGAGFVVGIEQSGRATSIIRQNWQAVVGEGQDFQIVRGDIRHKLPQIAGVPFDRIYFDPPYQSALYSPVIDAIARLSLLSPGGELAVEHPPKIRQAFLVPGLEIVRQKVYGSTALTFYRKAARSGDEN